MNRALSVHQSRANDRLPATNRMLESLSFKRVLGRGYSIVQDGEGKVISSVKGAKEGHGLRQDKNRKDYQKRILTWFGHYLKREKAEDWMTDGVTYAEQQRRLKSKGKSSKN